MTGALLTGCFVGNPRFLVDEDDGAGTAIDSQATLDPDTGAAASTGGGETTTATTATTATTGHVDPSVGDTSSSTGSDVTGDTTTGDETGATDTGETTGTSTTGGEQVESFVWHDLWIRCPDDDTH